MRTLLVALLFASFGSPAFSQITPLAQKWAVRYDGGQNRDDFSSVVVVDATGDFYVSGYVTDAQSRADVRVIKYQGTTGERLWVWQGNNPQNYFSPQTGVMPWISRLAIGPDGDLVLMAQVGGSYGGLYMRVLKLRSPDGSLLWEAIPPSITSALYCLAIDKNGDVLVGGTVNGRGGTVKYAGSSGSKIWQRQFGTSVSSLNQAVRAVLADSNGDVVVTGYEYTSSSKYQAYSAKYAGIDGAVRWEKRITDPTLNRGGRELVLDASGNAIVALEDGLLCKYAAGDGLQLWRRLVAATAYELLVDDVGDIYVASSVSTNAESRGASLEKIAGSNGALRWSASGSYFCSLVLRGDEILVAGQISYGSNDDFLLTAFNPSSGAQRWIATYGGNLPDRLSSTYRSRDRIALQPDGGVVLTGCSQGATTGFDFATVRFAPGPGVKSGGTAWVLPTSARLNVQARDNGAPGTIAWEYGLTIAYGQSTPTQDIARTPPLYTLTPPAYFLGYSATIGGLLENTTFHARAVAVSSAGITYGDDFTFTTGWDANGDHLPDEWELSNWGNTSARSATGDEDRDGLANLLEYALGQNPRVADSRGAIPIELVGEYLSALVTKRPYVTCVVEASADLRTWSADETVVAFEDAATLVVRDTVPASSGISRFFRIRVTAQ